MGPGDDAVDRTREMTQDAGIDFAGLYRALAPRVFAYVRRRVDDAQDAEDLTADVFVRAMRARSRPAAPSVEAWIFTIARNLVIDHARRRRWRRLRHPLLAAPVPPADPDDELLLASLLAELPADTRDAVLLRLAAGLSSAEVAAVMGKRPDAVKMMVHRGLTRLRRRWREEVSR